MFEKEAEEYANKCACLMEDIPIIERAYRTGADFGYNKANEWHYVKDGDLPKEDDKVLVLLKDGMIQIDRFYPIIEWCLSVNTDVIAWKEIVLPKEIE
jgi:hypothetical protein